MDETIYVLFFLKLRIVLETKLSCRGLDKTLSVVIHSNNHLEKTDSKVLC